MSWIDTVIAWYSSHMNYATIAGAMAIESSFIPFPSEVVIPPAAMVAADPASPLYVSDVYLINVALVVLAGTLGAIIGAMVNYGLAIWLGRPIIYKFADSRWGHLCLLSGEKVQTAEDYFNAHGKTSTLVGRLIPAVRQLISIPAGLARMPFGQFVLYTALGATAWNCVLAALGYIAHGQMDLIKAYSHELSIVILAVAGLVAVIYLIIRAMRRKRA